jgi:hypothetical protein
MILSKCRAGRVPGSVRARRSRSADCEPDARGAQDSAGTRGDDEEVLFQLATELPAAFSARTLGIDITVAVTWQRAAAGWAAGAGAGAGAGAAEISRRSPHLGEQGPDQCGRR